MDIAIAIETTEYEAAAVFLETVTSGELEELVADTHELEAFVDSPEEGKTGRAAAAALHSYRAATAAAADATTWTGDRLARDAAGTAHYWADECHRAARCAWAAAWSLVGTTGTTTWEAHAEARHAADVAAAADVLAAAAAAAAAATMRAAFNPWTPAVPAT